jgi:DNA-directed RNA polymerase I, II, and III subunit RPABC2
MESKFIYPLTKYEKARLIGSRAQQIANGAKILIDIKGLSDPIEIAKKEYKKGLIPLILDREMPDGSIIKIKLKPKKRSKSD